MNKWSVKGFIICININTYRYTLLDTLDSPNQHQRASLKWKNKWKLVSECILHWNYQLITWWCVWMWRIAGGGLRSLLEPSLFGGKSPAVPLKLAIKQWKLHLNENTVNVPFSIRIQLDLLGCDALGGTLFVPVADGIDVGGVCKLAWPKRSRKQKHNWCYDAFSIDWLLNLVRWIYLVSVHYLVDLDSLCLVVAEMTAAIQTVATPDVVIDCNIFNLR